MKGIWAQGCDGLIAQSFGQQTATGLPGWGQQYTFTAIYIHFFFIFLLLSRWSCQEVRESNLRYLFKSPRFPDSLMSKSVGWGHNCLLISSTSQQLCRMCSMVCLFWPNLHKWLDPILSFLKRRDLTHLCPVVIAFLVVSSGLRPYVFRIG